MSISSWFNGTSKTYPIQLESFAESITQDGKEVHTLYKKRVKNEELVEIGYQTKEGWVLHKPEPTPKFVADYLNKRGNFEVSSYYPGTYLKSGIKIVTSDFPQELYKNQNEVVGFILGDYYVYYDDFEHLTTKKEYIL